MISALLFLAVVAWGAVPQTINYQGYLKNTDGSPVNTSVSVVFSLYTTASGGSAIWTQTQNITPANGVYSVQLGGGSSPNPIPATVFANDTLYLGVKVGSDAEMTPRQQLTTTPYAFRAGSADNAVTISGQTLTNLDNRYIDPTQPKATTQQIASLRWDQVGSGNGTYTVGSNPSGLVFDGTSIWVANYSSNNVSKLNPASGAVIGTYNVGTGPHDIAFDGTSIWVANLGSDNVMKLNPDGTVIGTYALGAGTKPRGIAFDGTSIWVANYGTLSVSKLNPASGAVVGTYNVGTSPFDIAFDGANIWVANFGSNNVSKLNTSGGLLGTYNVGTNPVAIAFDGANIWVANRGSNSVSKLSTSGTVLGTYSVGTWCSGLAFDGANIWVNNFGSNNVVKINPATGAVLGTYQVGTNPWVGLAFDGANIWVANHGSDNVTKLGNVRMQVGAQAVGTAQIATAAVTTAQIANNAVTTTQLADSSVITAKLADSSVTTAKLADSSVRTAKLADSSVITAKLADSSVTTAKLADSSVTSAKLNVNEDFNMNDKTLYLRGDTNHGLGWYGPGKPYGSWDIEGPVLYGNTGGALGLDNGGLVLIWGTDGWSGLVKIRGFLELGGVAWANQSMCWVEMLDGFFTVGKCVSDVRLKKDVVTISDKMDVLEALSKMRGVMFTWDATNTKAPGTPRGQDMGMIAQEVEQVFPEIVHTGEDGYKSLDYHKFAAFLVEVNKAQQAQLTDQKALIDRLSRTTEELNTRLSILESNK
jgi:YVTN family beta-propeller protein